MTDLKNITARFLRLTTDIFPGELSQSEIDFDLLLKSILRVNYICNVDSNNSYGT